MSLEYKDEKYSGKKIDKDEESESRSDSDKKQNKDKKHLAGFSNYMLIIFFSLSLIMTAYLTFKITQNIYEKPEPVIDSEFISSKLDEASDLTTAVLTYNGLIQYSEGEIPFITQKSFSMIYVAEIRAGIDMNAVDINVTEDKVIITLPEVMIQGVDVDSNSISFYDEKAALFNWTDKDDVISAISAAEEDVQEKADIEGLKNKARTQAEEIIKGLLIDSIGERTLEIR